MKKLLFTLLFFLSIIIGYSQNFVEKYTNVDILKEYAMSTYPISNHMEKTFLNNINNANLEDLQDYLYIFWLARSTEPEKSWNEYMRNVNVVNHDYSTSIKKGYETDRGRVYLQYGAPNIISKNYNEPINYPYEIWQYYSVENQSNVKFVFYTRDMVTNDFILLHSTAIGEINNLRWQIYLRNRSYQTTVDISDTGVVDSWGNMQKDKWNIPD